MTRLWKSIEEKDSNSILISLDFGMQIKNIFLKLLLLSLLTTLDSYHLLSQTKGNESNKTLPLSGEIWYVTSPRGLNLRSTPSEKSQVVSKLPNKSSVKILKQNQELVQAKIKFLDAITPETNKPNQILLEGTWVKVEINGKEGYAFSPLLSPYPPSRNDEFRTGYDITPYLVRIFTLKKISSDKKQIAEDQTSYTQIFESYKSELGVTLNVEQSENEYGWGKAVLFLPNWKLETAFVFFYSIFSSPDFKIKDLSYIKETSAEYSLDEIPNTISFRKNKTGVTIEWAWGAD
ncbi:SH3 domain-containing protein [Leptospira paudalimensis]|uniref:SH3 domain-containing protein n=1 Tax=Leptospira paudalimensis TaxID=2950024 RepID=A0ABT3MA89_9LEPT|nr:SH3 domain-containing protein [Leptospira paudalimensis]MCW7505316.1 SH3 domain-containing protein [Leptospira paudalimensis]